MERSRDSSVLIIVLLYALPVGAWIAYTYQGTPLQFSWLVAIVGLAILFMGAGLMLALFRAQAENLSAALEPVVAAAAPAPIQVKVDDSPKYLQEIETLKLQLQEQNNAYTTANEKIEDKERELTAVQDRLKSIHEDIADKEDSVRRKIEDLQLESHQKQQIITQLENQIHDLRYEIKTLLQLTEVDYSQFGLEHTRRFESQRAASEARLALESFEDKETPVITDVEEEPPAEETSNPEPHTSIEVKNLADASKLLKRTLEVAEKMTTGYRASNLRSATADPYAFDLRRLSDALRLESGALIVVYAPKDERILFASREAKTLLGWSPEKFAQDFAFIAKDGLELWKSSADELLTKPEVSFVLAMQKKNAEAIPVHAVIGMIPSGIFRSLVIGIVYA